MKKRVITHNSIEGHHCYPDAPAEVGFLKNKHRHIFEIRCFFEVTDSNREIEIILMQRTIEATIQRFFGRPADFYDMSCEMIGEWILKEFDNCDKVEVLEDGYSGAIIQR